jgi:hypothetical protein
MQGGAWIECPSSYSLYPAPFQTEIKSFEGGVTGVESFASPSIDSSFWGSLSSFFL